MNLLYLDRDPTLCARMHHDKHVIKMTTELGIMLSSVLQHDYRANLLPKIKFRIIDSVPIDRNALYRDSHQKHPSVKWCARSSSNFLYAYDLFCALAKEYTYRFGKTHATYARLHPTLSENIRGILSVMGKLCKPLFLGSKYSSTFYFYAPPQVVPVNCQVYKGRGTFFQDKNVMIHYAKCATMMAYMNYYLTFFKDAKWTKRDPPDWFTNPAFLQRHSHELSLMRNRYNILGDLPSTVRSVLRSRYSAASYRQAKARYLRDQDMKWRNYQRNKLRDQQNRNRVSLSGLDITNDRIDAFRYASPVAFTNPVVYTTENLYGNTTLNNQRTVLMSTLI